MKQHSASGQVRLEGERIIGCILGSILYAAGINLFLVPAGLYTGGLMGFCQVFRTLLVDYLGLPLQNMDIAGIIYYICNIPIFLVAFPRLEKRFFIRTLFSVTVTTAALSLIPSIPLIGDTLTASLVGAVVSGTGTGILLRMSSSAGGMDALGMAMAKQNRNLSVGRVNLIVNVVLYAVCLFLFDIETVIYSLLYAAIYSFVMDKVHIQNITVEVKIITKVDPTAMEQEIFTLLSRGVTEMPSIGAYTHEQSHLLYVLLSKYEIAQLRSIVHKYDPHAFMVLCEGIRVDGNYMKKL